MSEEAAAGTSLQGLPKPTAIVHDGLFVDANPAFLRQLGYSTLEDLQAVPILDLVVASNHDRLRELLQLARKPAGVPGEDMPQARLTLVRSDELPLNLLVSASLTRHDGEECVRLELSQSKSDSSTSLGAGRTPWRYRLSVLFLFLLTVLPSGLLLNLEIDNTPTVYFPDDQPAVVLDRELRQRFPNDQVFVLLFEGVALYSDGFLRAYDAVGRELLQRQSIDDVLSLTRQDHISGTEDEFIVEPLIDAGRLPDSRPEERQQRVLGDRFSRRALASEDGSALAMVVVPAETGNSIERLALEQDILNVVEANGLRGYLTGMAGEIPVDVAQLRAMLRDNSIFIPATLLVELLLIWWLFRRGLGLMLTAVTIGVVVNSAMAIYVLAGQPFTLVTTIIPPLLSALTVAALVHLFNALQLYSRLGFHGLERVQKAVSEVERPARFAALTTAAGLASLASSDIMPIRMLGLVSAVGVLLAYMVVFHVLPHIIERWDNRAWPRVRGGAALIDRVVITFYQLGLRHPLMVLGVAVVLLFAGVPQIAKVTVETNLQEFFEPDHPIRRDTRRIDEKLVGTTPLAVTFDSDRRDGLKDPAKLSLIADFQHWLNSQPEVDRSLGVVDFIEEMHWAFNAEDPDFRRLPDSEQLISQYLFVYDGDDLFDLVDRDFQHSQVTVNLNVHSANDISAVIERIRDYLTEHVGDELEWDIAGVGRLFADMEDVLVAGQVTSLFGALGLIFLFMLLLLRSFGAALLCMIPNLSPILLIFTIMGALGIWLDMATAMIASIAVGVAVDDTIHVFEGFRRRVRAGISPVLAIARTYSSAGRAITMTTVILCVQFLVLTTTDFVPTRFFGLLTAIGLLTALLFDLLLLPALLIVFYGKDSPLRRLRDRLRLTPRRNAPAAGEAPAGMQIDWTVARKAALVREMLAGRQTPEGAASEHGLDVRQVKDWLDVAQEAINEVLDDEHQEKKRKLNAIARNYQKLREENRRLRRDSG